MRIGHHRQRKGSSWDIWENRSVDKMNSVPTRQPPEAICRDSIRLTGVRKAAAKVVALGPARPQHQRCDWPQIKVRCRPPDSLYHVREHWRHVFTPGLGLTETLRSEGDLG